MPVTFISNETIGAANTTNAIVLGLIEGIDLTGYVAGQTIYVAEGGGYSLSLPSGSNSITQLLGVITKGGSGGKGLVLNPGPAQLPGLDNGYMWVGGATNQPVEITTASFASSASFNTYTSSNDQKVDSLIARTGSYATTGSNVFIGDETFQDAGGNASTLVPVSGSLMLVAKSYSSASAHLSSSANQVNLIFKANSNTADTIISGSHNIFVNPTAVTAGFKRYIGGNNNIFNTINAPQISGSMQFSPVMTANIGGGTYIMRGPVSSSTYTINTNYNAGTVNIGTSATLNAEKLTAGLSMTQNNIAGTLNIVANQTALTGSTTTFSSNVLNGVMALVLSSSAASFQQSNINDGNFIFTNQYSSGALGLGSVSTSNNTIGGNSNTLIVTGSVLTGSLQPTMFNNLVIGATNTGFINTSDSRISGSNVYQNLLATSLLGNRLIVTGSSLGTDLNSFGSLFVGRWNVNDGIKNKTSDVIFAVGTGISGSGTTGRKTGFLIDSGSNTFVEGTLNVSGSTTMTGSLILSSSNAVELQVIGNSVFTGSVAGNVVSASITSNTASIDFSLGNYFEVTSSVTPLHLDVTNIGAGRTSTLIISASASSSILFSPNVAQPSGSVYSGSAGSIDILSLVAFNTSKVNLVSTKALV
jgi:hypothetical protein